MKNQSYLTYPGTTITHPSSNDILEIIDGVIEEVFSINSKDLRNDSRKREVVVPRQTYIALLIDFANRPSKDEQPKELSLLGIKLFEEKTKTGIVRDPGFKLVLIGNLFNKDHSTVLHSYKVTTSEWVHDKRFGYGEKIKMAYGMVKLRLIQTYKHKQETIEIPIN